MNEFEKACLDYQRTLKGLRLSTFINYKQIGMDYQLNSCYIYFNYALAMSHLKREESIVKNFKRAFQVASDSDQQIQATRGNLISLSY